MTTLIGTLREKSLHAELKKWYAQPGDQLEESVDGFVIDIVRGKQLIEVQSRSFGKIRNKLSLLCAHGPVRLIYPVASTKWIVRVDVNNSELGRRKSPKRGQIIDLFNEMIYLPKIAQDANFSFEVVLIEMEEIWRDDGLGSWRRKGWSIADRRLLKVLSQKQFLSVGDYAALMPDSMPGKFTNAMLADSLNIHPRLARKMSYCLHKMGTLAKVGKKGNAILYSTTS